MYSENRIVNPKTGRAFGVVPRRYAPDGYLDLDADDYQDGDIFKEMQKVVIETMESVGYVQAPLLLRHILFLLIVEVVGEMVIASLGNHPRQMGTKMKLR